MSDRREDAFERIERVLKELGGRPYTEVTVVKTEGGHSAARDAEAVASGLPAHLIRAGSRSHLTE